MKHRKHKIDLSDWTLDSVEKVSKLFEDAVFKAASEALQLVFEDDETRIFFPVEWSKEPSDSYKGTDGIGGKQVKEPLTVYLQLATSEDEPATFEFNLRSAVIDSIETCAEDGSYFTGLGRLSASLKKLAAEIDAARATYVASALIDPPASVRHG